MPENILKPLISNRLLLVRVVVVIFYAVGVAGLLIDVTHPLFLRMFPWFLVLNALLLAYYHAGTRNAMTLLVFSAIFLAGLLIEMAGVATGDIFGSYTYGNSLGIKLLGTPLVIGLNWLILVYATAGIMERVRIKPILQVFIASTAMVLYDLVMEQVAPKLDMWRWQNDSVPLQNYVSWFVLAFALHSLLKLARVKTANPVSAIVFACQFVFFVILLIFLP